MYAGSRIDIVAGIKQNLLLVIAAVLYWALALLDPWNLYGNASETVQLIQNLAWLSFVLVHGSKRYGWDSMFVFMGITFLITWSTETASIATGFPFGNYYYTHLLGMKIGTVPLVVMPAYFAAGYLAWTMATVFLGSLGTGIERRNLFHPGDVLFAGFPWGLRSADRRGAMTPGSGIPLDGNPVVD